MTERNESDEINLIPFLQGLYRRKFLIFSITILVTILSIVASLFLTNKYTSTSTLVLSSQQESAASSIGANVSGLAAIAGIDIGDSKKSEDLGIEIIKSRSFFKHLTSFDGVLEEIMAAESYDFDNKQTIFNENKFIQEKDLWVRKPKAPYGVVPTYLEAYEEYINEILTIYHDKRSGIVQISITHISPKFAYSFLDLIITEFNSLTRKKEIDRSNDALDYLFEESQNISSNEIREALFNIIEEQLKKKMISNIAKEYYFEIVDVPFIPVKKSFPQRSLIVILATFLGFIASILIALVLNLLDKRKSETMPKY